MAVLGRSRSGPPPDQILDPPLYIRGILYPNTYVISLLFIWKARPYMIDINKMKENRNSHLQGMSLFLFSACTLVFIPEKIYHLITAEFRFGTFRENGLQIGPSVSFSIENRPPRGSVRSMNY